MFHCEHFYNEKIDRYSLKKNPNRKVQDKLEPATFATFAEAYTKKNRFV